MVNLHPGEPDAQDRDTKAAVQAALCEGLAPMLILSDGCVCQVSSSRTVVARPAIAAR